MKNNNITISRVSLHSKMRNSLRFSLNVLLPQSPKAIDNFRFLSNRLFKLAYYYHCTDFGIFWDVSLSYWKYNILEQRVLIDILLTGQWNTLNSEKACTLISSLKSRDILRNNKRKGLTIFA